MFIHVCHPYSMFYHVYDVLSSTEIKGCIWADDKLGMYCRYKRNKKNPESLLIDKYDNLITEIRRGKIQITHDEEMEE